MLYACPRVAALDQHVERGAEVLHMHPVPDLCATAPHRHRAASQRPQCPPRNRLLRVLPLTEAVRGSRHDHPQPVRPRQREIVCERLAAGVGACRRTLPVQLVLLAERLGCAGPVDLVGRDVHDQLRVRLLGGVEHSPGALDVRVVEALRRRLAPGHVRLGGEVHDHGGAAADDDIRERLLGDVGVDRLDRFGEAGQPPRVARVGAHVHVHHALASGGGAPYEL